ncbi:MAG TPA: class I tRNA ligase family protein [Puia sp.]|nr:class I tRNA ligase family protein [Puia sp.]
MSKLIVTITPPTPNGNLHLGHISGPFLGADVFARLHRLRGHEVLFVCYSDDYQSYVDRKARELGRDRYELAGYNAHEIEKTMALAGISVDWFLKAYRNRYFKDAVSMFYAQAHRKGAIIRKMDSVPFSEEDQVYGYEAFGRGTCNYCGHESDASQCEHCARYPTLSKMGDLFSVLSRKKMGWRNVSREFLNLDLYRDYLLEYYAAIPLRPYLRDFITETLQDPHLQWPIDRPGECGIDIGINGNANRIHTWFSGIAGYLAACREYAAEKGKPHLVEDFWYSSQTQIVHFLGFDCSFSHAIVYPSLIHNVEGMTRKVLFYPNRFLKLEGKDFSTSRGIAIWVNDILKVASLDAVRYYLALHSPEEGTTNFEMEEFNKWHAEFYLPAMDKIRSVSDRMTTFTDGHLSAESPAYAFIGNWKKYSSPEHFSIRGMATELAKMLEFLVTDAAVETPEFDRLLQLYAVMGLPVHPGLSESLITNLGIDAGNIIRWIDQAPLFKPVYHDAC